MIRQFSLLNEKGISYSLMDVRKGFLHEPEGLGVRYNYGYSRIGTAWVQNDIEISQEAISGNLIFGGSPYEAAAAFINYAKKLTLVYATDAGTYYRDVDLVEFGKTEIGDGGVLHCPVVLMPRGLWYAPKNLFVQMGFGATGSLRYAYTLPNRFVNFGAGEAEIVNDGHVPAPFKFSVAGPLANPVLTLTVDGEEAAVLAISDTIAAGYTLEYSSRDGALMCQKTDGSTITNLIGALNIDNANFFKLPVGTSKLALTADTQIGVPVLVTVYKQYKVV